MDQNDIQKLILEDEDFVKCPRTLNSLKKFLAKNPEGADNRTISRLLDLSEERIEEIYQEAVEMLRKDMVGGSGS